MLDKSCVKIEKKSITGIRHPHLVVEGYLLDENCELRAYVDGKRVKNNIYFYSNNNLSVFQDSKKFLIRKPLEKTAKIAEVKISDGKDEVLVFKIRNTIFRRLCFKMQQIIEKLGKAFKSIGKGVRFLWREHHFLVPVVLWKDYFNDFRIKVRKFLNLEYNNPFVEREYNNWIKNVEEEPVYEELKYQPLISILIPVYNIGREYLSECLDSILNGHYQNFEICLADDKSTSKETIDTLKEYEKKDKRIKVVYRKENGHIAKATNSAFEISTGEFIGLMDNDDILTENALYEMAYALNKNKDLDFIYSDEDKLDMKGKRCEPHFKPNYSPDSLLGGNYICHFEIFRRRLYEEVGGEESDLVGAQDFDLFLKMMEKTTPDKVYHVPKVLYHWRKVPGSTADTIESKEYAINAGKKAVENALKRRGLKGEVLVPLETTQYVVEYKYDKEPKVSIIIPTRDYADTLEVCLKSIYKQTKYKNFEVIIADNDSCEEKTFKLFDEYQKKHKNFKVIKTPGEFNFAKINNLAVKESTGDYLLFLNNDTEVLTPTWINSMVGYAMQKHIGAVGVKLIYPDNTIQHGGVIVGIAGTARHAFLHTTLEKPGFYGRLIVPYNYSAVTAACMMVSKKKFNEVKGFNEDLKVAFNDIDLNLKLLEKNYYNVFIPQVELYHYESKSRGLDTTTKKYQQFLKEKEYFQKKWKKYIENDPFYNPNFSLNYDFMLDKKK